MADPETILPPQDEATDAAAAAALEATADAAEAAAPAPATEDIWSRIADLSPDELLEKHPKLKDHFHGHAGRMAQQQAQRLAQQIAAAETERIRAQLAAEQEQAQLRELRKTDPYGYAERMEQVEQRQGTLAQQQQAQLMAAYQMVARYDQEILHPALAKLPPEAQQQVLAEWNQYSQMPPLEGRKKFLDRVLDLTAEHTGKRAQAEAEKKLADMQKRLKELEAAAHKEQLGELNANDDVDTGGGAAGAGTPSWEQYRAMSREDREKIRKNPALYARMAKAGK